MADSTRLWRLALANGATLYYGVDPTGNEHVFTVEGGDAPTMHRWQGDITVQLPEIAEGLYQAGATRLETPLPAAPDARYYISDDGVRRYAIIGDVVYRRDECRRPGSEWAGDWWPAVETRAQVLHMAATEEVVRAMRTMMGYCWSVSELPF